jgi:hypothetical protein
MPLNNPGASTAPFFLTSASFAVHARIHTAGNTPRQAAGIRLCPALRNHVCAQAVTSCCGAHPVRHGGAVEIDALARIDHALAMQRQAIGVFRHRDVGEKAWPGPAAFDRQRPQRRLHDRLAGPAAHFRADMLHHLEARRNIFQPPRQRHQPGGGRDRAGGARAAAEAIQAISAQSHLTRASGECP